MAHLILAIDATPENHIRLLKEINERKYPMEQGRKGYTIPQMSEIKFYNIRLKKEGIPPFMRDLSAYNLSNCSSSSNLMGAFTDKKASKTLKLKGWFISKVMRLCYRAINVYPAPDKAEGDRETFSKEYYSTFCFGMLKDEEGKFRELL